jgi:hypothetical protein
MRRRPGRWGPGIRLPSISERGVMAVHVYTPPSVINSSITPLSIFRPSESRDGRHKAHFNLTRKWLGEMTRYDSSFGKESVIGISRSHAPSTGGWDHIEMCGIGDGGYTGAEKSSVAALPVTATLKMSTAVSSCNGEPPQKCRSRSSSLATTSIPALLYRRVPHPVQLVVPDWPVAVEHADAAATMFCSTQLRTLRWLHRGAGSAPRDMFYPLRFL